MSEHGTVVETESQHKDKSPASGREAHRRNTIQWLSVPEHARLPVLQPRAKASGGDSP